MSIADEFSILRGGPNIYNKSWLRRAQNDAISASSSARKQSYKSRSSTIAKQSRWRFTISSPIAEVGKTSCSFAGHRLAGQSARIEMTEKLLDRIKPRRALGLRHHRHHRRRGRRYHDGERAMLKMTRAATAAGSGVVLTGGGPRSRTMVQLNIEVEGARTMRTLRMGCAPASICCAVIAISGGDTQKNGDNVVFGQKAKGTTKCCSREVASDASRGTERVAP